MNKVLIALLLSVLMAACGKKDLAPVTGYNSKLYLDQIQFQNVPYVDSIHAKVLFEFLVDSDTSATPDTISFSQQYEITALMTNQVMDFDTPERTLKSSFRVSFFLYGGGADTVTVANFGYEYNGVRLINRPISFTGGPVSFSSPVVVHNF